MVKMFRIIIEFQFAVLSIVLTRSEWDGTAQKSSNTLSQCKGGGHTDQANSLFMASE